VADRAFSFLKTNPRQAKPRSRGLVELLNLCHKHNVLVSTGGFLEYVLTQGAEAVDDYVRECREVSFDIVWREAPFFTERERARYSKSRAKSSATKNWST
jgi:hypothetical protein